MANSLPDIESVFQAAGGRVAVAEALGIKVPSTYSWTKVPAARLPDMARLTGWPTHKLRPDLAKLFKRATQ